MIRLPVALPSMLWNCVRGSFRTPLDTRQVAKRVLELTNHERSLRRLGLLRTYAALDRVAAFHSANMAAKRFFAHEDPEGRGPQQRMSFLCRNLIGGAGENLALIPAGPEEWVAQSAVSGWMKSPGHRANMLCGNYTHLGVGVVRAAGGVYLTQSFGRLYIEANAARCAGQRLQARRYILRFAFLGDFRTHDLALLLEVPEKNATRRAGGGMYFHGAWPLPIAWLSNDTGETTIDLIHGGGHYRVFAGQKSSGQFAPSPLVIEVS